MESLALLALTLRFDANANEAKHYFVRHDRISERMCEQIMEVPAPRGSVEVPVLQTLEEIFGRDR